MIEQQLMYNIRATINMITSVCRPSYKDIFRFKEYIKKAEEIDHGIKCLYPNQNM